MKVKRIIIALIALLFMSCTSLGNYFKAVPSYDQKSYESFTYLKADIIMFYDTFTSEIDKTVYSEFIVRFNRIKEYEAGKTGNEEITQQIDIIRSMFERHCSEAPYSQIMLLNKKEIIIMAFDVIISTEYSKKR
jgi:hypothetical protein